MIERHIIQDVWGIIEELNVVVEKMFVDFQNAFLLEVEILKLKTEKYNFQVLHHKTMPVPFESFPIMNRNTQHFYEHNIK